MADCPLPRAFLLKVTMNDSCLAPELCCFWALVLEYSMETCLDLRPHSCLWSYGLTELVFKMETGWT